MSVVASTVRAVRIAEHPSAASLWVDPDVHAAECARFASYIVTGPTEHDCDCGWQLSVQMATGGTERRRHFAAESELSAAATGRTTDQSKRNCLCCNLISRRQSRDRGTISDRTQPGI